MSKVYEGYLDAKGLRFGLIVSRFNHFITDRLLEGALDALKRHGADENDMEIARVPGAFEIPFMAKKMADIGKYDAVICLGALIRGSSTTSPPVTRRKASRMARTARLVGSRMV